jgi:iron complex transport system permease protein
MKYLVKYCLTKNRIQSLYFFAVIFFIISFLLGVSLGGTKLPFLKIFDALKNGFQSSAEASILGYVRLPRTIAALACGAALSVSGAVIQGVLANRLAAPSIIGVNSGAALAVNVCIAFGILGGWQLSFFAFIGAFFVVILLSAIAKKWGASRGTVILIGVAMNSILGAISDAITTIIPEISVIGNDFKVGDFSSVTYKKLIPATIIIIVVIFILCTLHNELEVLTLGDDNSKGLGLNFPLMRTFFLLLTALLAGSAVSLVGLLSFVGLLVPHAVRRIAGTASIHLIILCALYGAGFVCICDTIARTAFSPYEIPVGIVMAFIGAPFFIFLLIRKKGSQEYD